MFTASRKDLAELLTLFRIVEDMEVAEGTAEGTPSEEGIPVEAVMREEDKVMRCYRREGDTIYIENDANDDVIQVDDLSGEGLCMIDLDTVMPGLSLYDFGDIVRSGTNPAEEDEPDLSKVGMRFEMYEALHRGYVIDI